MRRKRLAYPDPFRPELLYCQDRQVESEKSTCPKWKPQKQCPSGLWMAPRRLVQAGSDEEAVLLGRARLSEPPRPNWAAAFRRNVRRDGRLLRWEEVESHNLASRDVLLH